MCVTATDTEMMHFCFIHSEPDLLSVLFSVFYYNKPQIRFYGAKP